MVGKGYRFLIYVSMVVFIIWTVDLRAALAASDDKGKDSDLEAEKLKTEESLLDEKELISEHVSTVTDQISNLSVSSMSEVASTSMDQIDNSGPDIDKRIRALKKKVNELFLYSPEFVYQLFRLSSKSLSPDCGML